MRTDNLYLLSSPVKNLTRIFSGLSFRSAQGKERESHPPKQVADLEDFQFLVGNNNAEVTLGRSKRKKQRFYLSPSESSLDESSHDLEDDYEVLHDDYDTENRFPDRIEGDLPRQVMGHYAQEQEDMKPRPRNKRQSLRRSRKQIPDFSRIAAHRQSQSADDIHAAAARKAVDEELREARQKQDEYKYRSSELEEEVQKLKEELNATKDEATKDEATKDEATRAYDSHAQLEDLRQKHQTLSQEMTSQKAHKSFLEEKISETNAKFEDAKDRLMALQGVRRNSLVPMAIREEFQELLDGVESWVETWVSTLVDDESPGRKAALVSSLRNPELADKLREGIRRNLDFLRTCTVPNTDEDIIISLIWQFLVMHIFNTSFCNLEKATAIKDLESKMQACAKFPGELYAISVWRCRAMNALVKDPQIEEGRLSNIDDLTKRLGQFLQLFRESGGASSAGKLLSSIREKIIVPAIKLHELMICERDLYRLEFTKYHPSPEDPASSATASAAFSRDLENLDCLEMRGSRRVPLKSQSLPADEQELRRRLAKLCSVTPALSTRHISDKDGCDDRQILVKQKVLVLMDAEKWVSDKKSTFLRDLAFPDPALVAQSIWGGAGLLEVDHGQRI